jgi:hypothetical protein
MPRKTRIQISSPSPTIISPNMELTDEQREEARQCLAKKITLQQSLRTPNLDQANFLEETKISLSNFYLDWMKKFGDQYTTLDSVQKEEVFRFYTIITKSR